MNNEDSDFMGYKATCHCRPIIKREHNKRDPKIVSSEKHIDLSRPHETILDCGTLEKCYKQIFDEAVKKYNELVNVVYKKYYDLTYKIGQNFIGGLPR